MQAKFLSSLSSYASDGVYFATHSYGLARTTADQIYVLNKLSGGETDVRLQEETPDLPHVLSELTYSGYRELGFKKILLAEGVCDLPILRRFLRQLRKDQDVVVFPLGGDAMINAGRVAELEEVKRITTDLAVIIDSERANATDPLRRNRAEFQAACTSLDVVCHVLERRAIENYLTEPAIQKIKGPQYRALRPFERFTDIPLSWSKDKDNRDVSAEMTFDDIRTTDLGTFLSAL
jgi:hypothetical protein